MCINYKYGEQVSTSKQPSKHVACVTGHQASYYIIMVAISYAYIIVYAYISYVATIYLAVIHIYTYSSYVVALSQRSVA